MSISVAYLLRVAENLIRRRHGREVRYREVLARSGKAVQPDAECGAAPSVLEGSRDEGASAGRDGARIHAVLRLLTPCEQSAVRLIVCQGLDYQSAARSLGVPVSTVNNWKHRALAKLKQLIESGSPPDRAVRERVARAVG